MRTTSGTRQTIPELGFLGVECLLWLLVHAHALVWHRKSSLGVFLASCPLFHLISFFLTCSPHWITFPNIISSANGVGTDTAVCPSVTSAGPDLALQEILQQTMPWHSTDELARASAQTMFAQNGMLCLMNRSCHASEDDRCCA